MWLATLLMILVLHLGSIHTLKTTYIRYTFCCKTKDLQWLGINLSPPPKKNNGLKVYPKNVFLKEGEKS